MVGNKKLAILYSEVLSVNSLVLMIIDLVICAFPFMFPYIATAKGVNRSWHALTKRLAGGHKSYPASLGSHWDYTESAKLPTLTVLQK